MVSYWQLLLLILPVFALIGVGVALRRARWIEGPTEASLIRLVINVCMPCLIFESVAGNPALLDPRNLALPPLVGFGSTVVSIGLGYAFARAIGLKVGSGQ